MKNPYKIVTMKKASKSYKKYARMKSRTLHLTNWIMNRSSINLWLGLLQEWLRIHTWQRNSKQKKSKRWLYQGLLLLKCIFQTCKAFINSKTCLKTSNMEAFLETSLWKHKRWTSNSTILSRYQQLHLISMATSKEIFWKHLLLTITNSNCTNSSITNSISKLKASIHSHICHSSSSINSSSLLHLSSSKCIKLLSFILNKHSLRI